MDAAPLLRMEGISKAFPGVVALDAVRLEVAHGSVHALVGENGAGKSTLMKILIGMYTPDEGTITFEGEPLHATSTQAALHAGISMIHQELSPVPEMSVAENIYLGREPRGALGLLSNRQMIHDASSLFATWGLDLDPRAKMRNLTVAGQQMVEIAKAISYGARLVIMDEPTSALSDRETEALFSIIRRLQSTGVSVIYISHRMDEIFEMCDTATVFRDGRYIDTLSIDGLTPDRLITLMVGRELTEMFPKLPAQLGEVVLSVRGLTRVGEFRDISFDLHRGEILGLAGLMGAGRTEVLETIFGIRARDAGTIAVGGREARIQRPEDAVACGMGLLTEDRKGSGIMGVLSVRDNMTVASLKQVSGPFGWLRMRQINAECQQQREALSLKTPSLSQAVDNLSGGNQQKVLISRWLLTNPDILMIDEPTRGIDVGAKAEIHRLISSLAQQGKAILMVSSEMPEVLGMSDRIIVMHEGALTGELLRDEATQERIALLATGGLPAERKA